MAPRKIRASSAAVVAGTVALVAALLGVIAAPEAHADGTVKPGNQKCSDLVPGARELKVENPPSGSHTDGTLRVVLTVHPLASDVADHPGDQTGNEVFDFTVAGGGVVLGIGVKGGPNTNFYAYPDGVTSDTLLHAPVHANNNKFPDLSHVSFCYVPKAKPKIRTTVSRPEITVGETVFDTAHLTEGSAPTGTITFKVYGPDDATCARAPIATFTVTVNGNGSYPSPAFTANAVGTYRWIASYGGNLRNDAATGACNDPYEQVVVKKAKPKIRTAVSRAEITIGGSVTDTAYLSDGYAPTGTITFKVYGPDDATCTRAPEATFAVGVDGNGSYPSPAFTPDAVGTYRWIASYGGDPRNDAATGACDDPSEQVVVKKAKPQLATVPYVLPNDTATLTGLVGPTNGTIVFKLYGNATCSGTPIYVQAPQRVDANGTYQTTNSTVRVSTDSTIGWIVEYSGDAKNEDATSSCTDEQVILDFTPLGS